MKFTDKRRVIRLGAALTVFASILWAVGCHFHIHHQDYYEQDAYDEHRPYGTVGHYPKHFY